MFGAILGGIGNIIGGAASLAGNVIGGVGRIAGPMIGGGLSLAGQTVKGLGTIAGQIRPIGEVAMPAMSLYAQISENRAAERIARKQIGLAQQQIQAQKDIAFQNALLSRQLVPVQITKTGPQPQQIITPAQPEPAEKADNRFFLMLILAIIGILLLSKYK